MRKIEIGKNGIMTMPQLMARYEEMAVKVAKMEKKLDKQTDKIFEILNKLLKFKMKRGGKQGLEDNL